VHESNVEIVHREHWPGRFARGYHQYPSATPERVGYFGWVLLLLPVGLKELGCSLKKAPQGDRVRSSRRKRRDTIKTP